MSYLSSDDDSSIDDNSIVNFKEKANLLNSTAEDDTIVDFEVAPIFQVNHMPRPASKYEVNYCKIHTDMIVKAKLCFTEP